MERGPAAGASVVARGEVDSIDLRLSATGVRMALKGHARVKEGSHMESTNR